MVPESLQSCLSFSLSSSLLFTPRSYSSSHSTAITFTCSAGACSCHNQRRVNYLRTPAGRVVPRLPEGIIDANTLCSSRDTIPLLKDYSGGETNHLFHDNHLNHGHHVVLFAALGVACLALWPQIPFHPKQCCQMRFRQIILYNIEMPARRFSVLALADRAGARRVDSV